MFKKTLSGLSLVAAAFGLAAFSAPAAASCTDANNPGWDCVNGGASVSNEVYSGSATMSHWYTGTIDCDNVTATGDVSISGGTANLAITDFDGSSSSNPSCANVTFHNFNWTGSDSSTTATSDTDTTPTDFTVGRVVIKYNGTTVCDDSAVDVTFANDGSGGSTFDFNTSISGWGGSCNIDGTLANSSVAAH